MKEYLIYTFSYQLLLSTTSTLLLKIIFSIFNSNQSSQMYKLQKEYQLEQNTIPLQIFLAPNQCYTKKWINKEIKGEGGNILAHAVQFRQIRDIMLYFQQAIEPTGLALFKSKSKHLKTETIDVICNVEERNLISEMESSCRVDSFI